MGETIIRQAEVVRRNEEFITFKPREGCVDCGGCVLDPGVLSIPEGIANLGTFEKGFKGCSGIQRTCMLTMIDDESPLVLEAIQNRANLPCGIGEALGIIEEPVAKVPEIRKSKIALVVESLASRLKAAVLR